MRVEPREDRPPQLRCVAVRCQVLDEIEVAAGPECRVLMANAMRHVAVAEGPPEDVFGAGGDEEGPRGDEGADVRPAPAVIIDPEGAVAVPVGRPIDDDVLDAPRLADGHYALDA